MTSYKLRAADVAFRLEGEEAIVVQLERKMIHLANPAASVLLRALEAGATNEALVSALVGEFDIDAVQAERDVQRFVETSLEHGLICVSDGGERLP
jgi:hypothetical protein